MFAVWLLLLCWDTGMYRPFSPSWSFLIEWLLRSKTYFTKIVDSAKYLGFHPFPDSVGHFESPCRPLCILTLVRRCSWWASAPGAARMVFFHSYFPCVEHCCVFLLKTVEHVLLLLNTCVGIIYIQSIVGYT